MHRYSNFRKVMLTGVIRLQLFDIVTYLYLILKVNFPEKLIRNIYINFIYKTVNPKVSSTSDLRTYMKLSLYFNLVYFD